MDPRVGMKWKLRSHSFAYYVYIKVRENVGRDLICHIENRLDLWKMGMSYKIEADLIVSLQSIVKDYSPPDSPSALSHEEKKC